MKYRAKFLSFLGLILLAGAINWFTLSPQRVEVWYSKGIYLKTSGLFRVAFGWLPFSFGDLIYLAIICYFIWTIWYWMSQKKTNWSGREIMKALYSIVSFILLIWTVFQLLWGINYYRSDIGKQFDLEIEKPTKEELKGLSAHLLAETNRFAAGAIHPELNTIDIRKKVLKSYDNFSKVYPHLEYKNASLKSSLFGELGNYMGYSGYYNPLTGEAQINTAMPLFTLPFTALHEVAHQLGYAKESEANFIGYVSSTFSNDSTVKYAASLEMFLYANATLYRKDSTAANQLEDALSPIAKRDLAEYETFLKKYEGPIDKMTSWFYNKFLKVNNQPEGLRSYSKVILWLVAYEKKKGNKQ